VIVGSLALSLGLTAVGDRQAQAQRSDPRKHSRLVPNHDATELRVLDWTLWNVSKYYVEPERVDPRAMTLAGLEALERRVAQVLVQPIGKGERVRVRVATHEKVFELGEIEALWAVGPHVREVFRFVTEHTDLTEDEQREAEYAIVAGVLSTLDPHTNLLRPSDFSDMKASTKGSFGGLGIEVGMRDGKITVIRVIDGNPASAVDMQPGDRIAQIGSESTVTMTLNEAVDRLRGPAGTDVSLYVMREGMAKPKRLSITRATIKLDSVIGEKLEVTGLDGEKHHVGLVQIPRNFAQTTGKELRAKLGEFEKAGVEGIVLDLRDNPGGLLNAAVEVADAFLDSGTIVSTVGVSSPREENRANDRYDFPDLPLVVLIDQGSASASEIVAGALRNLGRGVLMGRRSFGKGSVQVLHERKAGDKELALKLTIAQYLTPGDVSIQSVGVSPDIETVPVWIGKEQIYYFGRGRFDLLREESLASHLTSNAKTQKIAHGSLHFLDAGSVMPGKTDKADAKPDTSQKNGNKKSSKKNSKKGANTPSFLDDPEIRMAAEFVAWAPSSDRDVLLRKMGSFVEQQEQKQQGRITKSLSARDVDWTLGTKPTSGSAKLQVSITTDKPGNKIRGGERGTVTAVVKNIGDATAYQVRAITDSDYRYFDEREMLFGKVAPGESRTYSLKLSVSEHELSRTDRIDVHLFEAHGAKLAKGSTTSIDVSAEGLPRPQFVYGYQVIDDPALGESIVGNGDGALQVGERVRLRVSLANQGEGDALDTWVTLRNRAGDSVFLHEGRKDLGKVATGNTRAVDLDFELKERPQDGDVQLQLTVSDNKIAEALSERIHLPVPERGVSLSKAKGTATATAAIDLYASPLTPDRTIGRVAKGVVMPAIAEGDGWVRVHLGGDQMAFAKSSDVERGTGSAKAPSVTASFEVSPPKVMLDAALSKTDSESVTLSGIATDEQALRDVFVTVYNPSRNLFGDREKVYYVASPDPTTGELKFSAEVPLTPGNNIIEVHARQNDDVVAIRRMWVLRTSGLAEARAADHEYNAGGKLRVDTFQ